GKIAAELHELIDLDLIRQKIGANVLDLTGLLSYVLSKMSQLCAPMRDASIRAIAAELKLVKQPPDFVSVIESTLGILDDMKLDLANFRLQSLRPYMKDMAVEYELNRFRQALESGSITLAKTKDWLTRSVRTQEDVARSRNPEGVNIPENRLKYADAFYEAALALVFSWKSSADDRVNYATTEVPPGAASSEDDLPETMIMDKERLFKFQNEAQKVTVVAVLLVLSQNIVPELRGDKGFTVGLKEALWTLLSDPEGLTVDHLVLQVMGTVRELLKLRRGKDLEDERAGLIKTMVEKTVSTRDPVFNVVRRRVIAAVKTQVASGTFKRDGLDKAGLEPIRTELESLSAKVSTWIRFNGEVYAEFYDAILNKLTQAP
ncbi:hypothetical protein HK405_007988, partial [Cladochytrium tenue]